MKCTFFLLIFMASQVLVTQNLLHSASEPDYPPFCVTDKNGQADGFSVELFRAATEAIGYNVEFKVDTWNKIKKELEEGTLDALPLVGRSPEREKIYDFTFPYHTLNGAVFIRKGTNKITTLIDLKDKQVLVMKGDNAEEYARRVNISNSIITTDTYEEAFMLLSSGRYDAVIAQNLMGQQLLKSLGIRNIAPLRLEVTGFAQDFSFAVRDGNKDLLAKLNEGLAIIIADGTYDNIHKKWFSPITSGMPTFIEVLRLSLYILVPTIILIACITILILRSQVKSRTKKLRKEIADRIHAEQIIKKQLAEKEIILKEVHHRIKNNFSSVAALLSFQADSVSDPEALTILNNAIGKVTSMAVLYENLLLKDNYNQTSIKNYLDKLLDEIMNFFSNEIPVTLERDLDDFPISPHYLFSIGLIVNELMTNINKYAFKGKKSGLIRVILKKDSKGVHLAIIDNGIGFAQEKENAAKSGFGLALVKILCERINGTITIKNESGTRTSLDFELSEEE